MKVLLKFHQFSLLILFVLVSPLWARSQDRHVHTEYLEKVKQTRVYTDSMHVIDTPSQFMFVELVARYPKQQLIKPSNEIYLKISSVTKQALYGKAWSATKKFIITADEESIHFDPPSYEALNGGTLNGKDVFFGTYPSPIDILRAINRARVNPNRSVEDRIAYESTLPSDAQIMKGNGINGLLMERIVIMLNHKKLLRLANAQKTEVKLGDTTIWFTKNQTHTIREFSKRITP